MYIRLSLVAPSTGKPCHRCKNGPELSQRALASFSPFDSLYSNAHSTIRISNAKIFHRLLNLPQTLCFPSQMRNNIDFSTPSFHSLRVLHAVAVLQRHSTADVFAHGLHIENRERQRYAVVASCPICTHSVTTEQHHNIECADLTVNCINCISD